jgi:hypothetical protein
MEGFRIVVMRFDSCERARDSRWWRCSHGREHWYFDPGNGSSLEVPVRADPGQLFVVRHSGRFAENTRFSYLIFQDMRSAMPPSAIPAAITWPGGGVR